MEDYNIFLNKLLNDQFISELILDPKYAQKLYSALCDNTIICLNKRKNIGEFSYRKSAEIVSNMRNVHVHMGHIIESYSDYYMTGNEGMVFPEVRDQLERLGYSVSYFEE